MQVAVWDTYVIKRDGKVMHFDIIAPAHIRDEEIIYTFGKDYLRSKDQGEQWLTAKECNFCHIEKATPEMESSIRLKGYYIYECKIARNTCRYLI
ncbi:MAG: DUF2024 family protein [Bacteroidota bacterium]